MEAVGTGFVIGSIVVLTAGGIGALALAAVIAYRGRSPRYRRSAR